MEMAFQRISYAIKLKFVHSRDKSLRIVKSVKYVLKDEYDNDK